MKAGPLVPAARTPGDGSAGAPAVALHEVSQVFSGQPVLGPLSLAVDAGAVAVVCGVNGAGKTTLLRIAAGLLSPSTGRRCGAGRAVYLRPGSGGRRALTAGQVLTQTAALSGAAAGTVEVACRVAGLHPGLLAKRVGELSAGQHTRLSAALAVAAAPRLACLDEPTAHLDDEGIDQVRATVALLAARGVGVLLVTHAPAQFTGLTDAVLRLDRGLLTVSAC